MTFQSTYGLYGTCDKCGMNLTLFDMQFYGTECEQCNTEWIDKMMRSDYVYDIEVYPNIFTLAAHRVYDGARWIFEISDRRNDSTAIMAFLHGLRNSGSRMVGYNNLHYDYPVIHEILTTGYSDAPTLYAKSMSIINGTDKFSHVIWDRDQIVSQIDLFKIHHFDNKARSTSLKALEFNMRLPNISDLPFPPGTVLTHKQMDTLIAYNWDDIEATTKFYEYSQSAITLREELSEKYGRNMMNYNDTKIGETIMIMKLEEAGVRCYDANRKPLQTYRSSINLSDAIFPYIKFTNPEFNRVKDWLSAQTIRRTKGLFKDLTATVNGFEFSFGLGGIHGSVSSQTVVSDADTVIIDLDVASYYPNLAIVNHIYPEHLSEEFCTIYKSIYEQRRQHKKGTPENAALKLALNGTYGKSNSQYSPFYDSLFTMKITLNGQLLLCMLAEQLMTIPGLEMIQVNTDGLTVRVPRTNKTLVDQVSQWWQDYTLLTLEEVEYSRFWVRDVNNYIGEYADGKLKRKGAYEYVQDINGGTLGWHQDHSALVVQKAAEAALVRGKDIETFIRNHDDVMDFMLRAKVPRSSRLELDDTQIQNTTRFYVTDEEHGGSLVKVMPPTSTEPYTAVGWRRPNGKKVYYSTTDAGYWGHAQKGYVQVGQEMVTPEERRIGLCVGWKVQVCNDLVDVTAPINLDYYVQETRKLVDVVAF